MLKPVGDFVGIFIAVVLFCMAVAGVVLVLPCTAVLLGVPVLWVVILSIGVWLGGWATCVVVCWTELRKLERKHLIGFLM